MASLEQNIQKFKFDLLRAMPFYGDIVMRLQFVETTKVATAATNGRDVIYNHRFLRKLRVGEQNFVFMHEILHILLLHCKRGIGKNRDIWNTACDMVINTMLSNLRDSMKRFGIPCERPKYGVFENVSSYDDVENVYAKICEMNKKAKKYQKLLVKDRYYGNKEVNVAHDIIEDTTNNVGVENIIHKQISNMALSGKEAEDTAKSIENIIRESASKNRSNMGSYFVPDVFLELVPSKKIKWSTLLRNFFTEQIISDEVSYTTPERKYIHMDLILPGHSMTEDTLENVWAFVDSSGSISDNELNQFLTQLYRIAKSFKCVVNICYWDTEVTDVYKNITREKDVLKCIPHNRGGTDINCVYSWIRSHNIKPSVLLILTDGYFGDIIDFSHVKRYKNNTIMVLSSDICVTENMKKIGKIIRL